MIIGGLNTHLLQSNSLESLNLVYVSGGENELEILVIQTDFHGDKCRFINAYGPQEYAEKDKIIAFYSRLDQEIRNAKLLNCLICVQMDSNAKLGYEVIKGDVHNQSENGKILETIICSNDLFLCNADSRCEGLFTRERNDQGN